MGRARKPLSEQAGNLTREIRARKTAEESMAKTGNAHFLKPPKWLINAVAVKEYRRLVKELKNLDMLGNLDTNALGSYCNAFAKYLEVTEELKTAPMTVLNGSGTPVENPLFALQMKYSKEMRDTGRLCGLTIDSRLKFASTKLDRIEENITEEFGDI